MIEYLWAAGDVVRHQLGGARDAAHRASGDLFRRDVGLLSQLRASGRQLLRRGRTRGDL
ncbi:hypothetical protein [Olsenella sp. oral taxon 807]|uniref:hypothetical protein n=1 Tax=Olsenella sp. oral taxon 807 TaxID=712411 RepID=UPI00155DB8CF|nr:hypothetical protein [Olsenella sp. oral taxon 807]